MKQVFNNKISPYIIKQFKEICVKNGVAYSDVVEKLLENWLDGEIAVDSKKEAKIQFGTSIDSELVQLTRQKCEKEDATMSYVVEQLMLHYCNQQNAPSPSENIPQTKTKVLSSNLDKAIQLLTDLRDDLERT